MPIITSGRPGAGADVVVQFLVTTCDLRLANGFPVAGLLLVGDSSCAKLNEL